MASASYNVRSSIELPELSPLSTQVDLFRSTIDWRLVTGSDIPLDGREIWFNRKTGEEDFTVRSAIGANARTVFSTATPHSAGSSGGQDEDLSRFTGTYGIPTVGTVELLLDLSNVSVFAGIDGVSVKEN